MHGWYDTTSLVPEPTSWFTLLPWYPTAMMTPLALPDPCPQLTILLLSFLFFVPVFVSQVRGFCKDLSNPDVFETTNVYGDIIGSDIHHNYYGHYSYGHQGGVWTNNKMHDNHQYGFDPHDDSDYLTIADNEVYNNVNHGIIASKRCNNVQIYNNVVRDGGPAAAGIFLHRSSDFAEVHDNTIYNMQVRATMSRCYCA